MKCLMRMCAEEDKGVVFYETVINIKWQKHTVIECVPLPWDLFEQVPAYFKVCTTTTTILNTIHSYSSTPKLTKCDTTDDSKLENNMNFT